MFHIINTKKSPLPMGPYVQAIDIGNIVFVSGQIGICPDTDTIPDNIYDQTHQSLNNIQNIIKTAGLKINNIIKTTLFVIDINDMPTINASYKNFFHSSSFNYNKDTILPTRSCIEVSRLPKNAKIEIEAIAARIL
ncbi:Rid family detoxifying hydrolase [Blochmannia endosymbiont of Camponotus sp. C-003]|uniref:Rid family detoxifying hydrolase n=1 Tax=unclassified Candidatus Blochmanniella TaxID=711328 RepID=UPI002023C953|nr:MULTISPECIES: Rid family detoxifying hydrolase [unclassified Candidatus Blochmannia]URJ23196.1 Rid family detoxifying hydrolase [Blochmannia endosymbiont of Camponotus sp. C-003]URJ28665.1 Rid family detoxifying hydrolase [Blochmannia endosymbiont of Camponotus sp. C-046]